MLIMLLNLSLSPTLPLAHAPYVSCVCSILASLVSTLGTYVVPDVIHI